jgi:hypothetical protein
MAAVPLGCLKIAKHDHQQVVEVVCNTATELPNGFELLRRN